VFYNFISWKHTFSSWKQPALVDHRTKNSSSGLCIGLDWLEEFGAQTVSFGVLKLCISTKMSTGVTIQKGSKITDLTSEQKVEEYHSYFCKNEFGNLTIYSSDVRINFILEIKDVTSGPLGTNRRLQVWKYQGVMNHYNLYVIIWFHFINVIHHLPSWKFHSILVNLEVMDTAGLCRA